MSDTGSGGSHSHATKPGGGTYAAGSHRHTYTDLVGTGIVGPPGPTGPIGPAGPPGPVDPTLVARIDALEARVAALEGTPEPPPPPPPVARPFPAPVTTRTIQVPAGADLQAAVNAAPDGSILALAPGATWTMARGLILQGRKNLVIEGNGATIIATGPMTSMWSDPVLVYGGSDIAVRGLNLVSGNTRTGSEIYYPAQGEGPAVGVYGATRVEIDGCTMRQTSGDAVYAADTGGLWTDGLWVHGCTMRLIGRNGFTVNAARNVWLDHNDLDQMGGSVLDIEPDLDNQGVDDLFLTDNLVGTWGLCPTYTMHFVACANQWAGTASTVNGVTIARNVVSGRQTPCPNAPDAGSLATWIGKPARQTRITFTDNVGKIAGRGPVLRFEHIDGLIVRGNVQPLTSGPLATIVDCTGVVQG